MKFIKIDEADVANGPGVRAVLWCSGCEHHCEGCHNPETWNPKAGKDWDGNGKIILFKALEKPYCKGLTLTGGDPFHPANRNAIRNLLAEMKIVFGNSKDVWAWTGYNFEDLREDPICNEILQNIDVLVDGPFKQEIRTADLMKADWKEVLAYRGSSNQRIINVKESLEYKKKIVFYEGK